MANISKINVNQHEYNIKDAVARAALGTLTGSSAVPIALNNKVGYADYRTVTENSATKHYIYFYKDDSDAPVNASTIPSTYLCKIDAAPFIKDGMVSSVAISNGNLVITWNSDSTGVTTPTNIPLTDIFNASNYYDKDAVDGLISGVEAGLVDVVDNLTTQDATKALSANQGYTLNTNKANKSELSITAVTGKTDRKNVQLKSGVSQEFLIAHQDISGKADKTTAVTNVGFDTSTGTLSQTINGSSSPIITLDSTPTSGSKKPVTSGAVYTALDGKANKSEMSVTAGTGDNADKTTIQLKSGTSATVLTEHQDISGKADKPIDFWKWYRDTFKTPLYPEEAAARVLTASEQAALDDIASGAYSWVNSESDPVPLVFYHDYDGYAWMGINPYLPTGVAVKGLRIRVNQQNKYWTEDFSTFEHELNYNTISNLPTLNTNNSTAQEFSSDEIIKNTIKLHKISKTGTLAHAIDDETHRLVTDVEKSTWSGKYDKPTGGIPSTHMTSAVQASLGLADTAVQDSSYVHTDNNYTTAEKTKLSSIAAGAEVNVQSDWNQTTTTADDYIKNKPTNVSSFTNDAGYQTSSQVTSTISSAVSGSYTASTETLSLTLPTFTTA